MKFKRDNVNKCTVRSSDLAVFFAIGRVTSYRSTKVRLCLSGDFIKEHRSTSFFNLNYELIVVVYEL